MSLGAAKAATFGASNQAGDVVVSPLPVGLAIMSAADPTKNNLAGFGIARDASGHLYVPSYFNDTVDANANVAITKYDGSTMAVLWSKHIQSAAADAATGVGNVIAVSDGVIVASQHDTVAGDIYLAVTKLDFDGTLVWAKHISDVASVSTSRAVELSTGDLVVAAAGSVGLLVTRLTSAGVEVWKKDYTTVLSAQQVVVDGSDNIYIGGHATDVVSYAGVVKLNSAGVLQANPRWNLSTVYHCYCNSISLDSSDNVYLAGRLTNSATTTDSDGFLMKLNSSLVLQWTRKIKAAPTDQLDQMQAEVGPDDMIYVSGYTKDADAILDGFLAKYDTAGVLQWKRSLVTGRTIGARPALIIDDTNVTALLYGVDTSSVYDTCTFTVPIDGTGLGTYNDAVYADATNVTDSAYAGVTAYGNFGLTEVASSAVIGAGDEVLLESGLTSDWFPEAGSKAYRYYRLAIHTIVDDADVWASLGELQLMVGGTAHPTVDMTSNVLPSPLVASADAEHVSYPAHKAFDGLNTAMTDRWLAAHTPGLAHWLQIDLGAGNAIQLTGYKLTGPDGTLRAPASWTLYGSDTGAFAGEEEGIHSESGHTWAAWEEKTFTF